MKLIIVLCIEEQAEDLRDLFRKSGVSIFSETDVQGFNKETGNGMLDNWFSGKNTGVFSHLFFTFIMKEKAEELMSALKDFKENSSPGNKIHAFQMDVEKLV